MRCFWILTTTLSVLLAAASPQALYAQGTTSPAAARPLPLLDKDGKPLGLYRRVVSKPGAAVRAFPNGDPVVDHPATFSTHYIFEEVEINSQMYYKVGPPGKDPTGWISGQEAVEWPNNVSLVFKVPVERYRALFFDGLTSVVNFRDADPLGDHAQDLTNRIASSQDLLSLRLDTGLMATEGPDHVDWSSNFYLMPVLDFEQRLDSRGRRREDMYLKTAVVPLSPDAQAGKCATDPNVAIVFVIDTTNSMADYIARTRVAVEKMVATIRSTAAGNRVSFGLVGFRDDPAYRAGIDYRSKIFQALDPSASPGEFDGAIGSMNAATVSTEGYSEDALAGVVEALGMDWSPFQSKWIVLITDASPREFYSDRLGNQHSIQSVAASLWDRHKTGLMAIHLQTPESRKAGDIPTARDRLESLARWTDVDTAYYPIKDGNVAAFGSVVEDASDRIIGQINLSIGQLKSGLTNGDAIDRIGYAQRVIWLGECNDVAPSVIEGWAVQNAVHRTGAPPNVVDNEIVAIEPRILLTRQQLDNLVRVLETVYNSAQQDPQETDRFFDNLISNLVVATLDANQLSVRIQKYRDIQDFLNNEVDDIRDLLPSYLTIVPFKTDFLTMTADRWSRMTTTSRDRLIETLRSRIDGLKTLYNSTGWVKLHKDSSRSEEVMPVLTSLLP